jgi:hypothetical protein
MEKRFIPSKKHITTETNNLTPCIPTKLRWPIPYLLSSDNKLNLEVDVINPISMYPQLILMARGYSAKKKKQIFVHTKLPDQKYTNLQFFE